MKRIALMVVVGVFLFSGIANAALTLIGTASYDSDGNGTPETYNLIHMDDGPFGPITWLDYTKEGDNWQNQMNWASGLSFAEADIQLNPGYKSSIDWSTGWRLPETDESQANLSGGFGYEGPDGNGYHDYMYGYNMVNSEMGQLYYEELDNKGYYATDGTNPQPGWGLNNTGDFNYLQAYNYWSGTESSPYDAWNFNFNVGSQGSYNKGGHLIPYALAVRPGDVSAVPVPGTVLLLGTGLAGLGVFRRGQRRRHWVIG
ncbi:PEP-CTERM sorting domain-containing protein [Desulfatitalea tepidiphila]|uniref:PEP-CTERM sorting domain-containing protein n=1 Tax=Desulfatitalea tepidiphila TaxID=1185843 RepID=UPI0006B4A210|nr:PEP-CTERM sorting domain-containing protein [Desulfatitalea tepidiphila]